MRSPIRVLAALLATGFVILMPGSPVFADESKGHPRTTAGPSQTQQTPDIPTINLLDALRDKQVSAQIEGTGDGRVTLSLTNRTHRKLRVVLPPGIVAQSATGQMGGMMGGMGGGMGGMGGGMMGGMGGMGGGMGGMGGGMGGMGGGMGGMGGGMGGGMMGGGAQTMPPMMGMMMLANVIMYFCGDFDSWDRRSLMMGMGGGGMMGGMGGGMGGMGGGMMGGMGGGMRSVPPSDLPSAELKPKQTRHLPTQLVSLSPPDPESGVSLPAKGETLRILGDIGRVSDDPRVQKALKRLAAETAPPTISQLVMWRLVAGLDWETIARLSERWSNRSELTLAQDFVAHLDALPVGESGRLLFQFQGADAAGKTLAAEVGKAVNGKMVLGVIAEVGEIPAQPEGPAVACQVRLTGSEALVQVTGSNEAGRNWVPFGKFTLPIAREQEKFDAMRLVDAVAEGMLNRMVRMQLTKGPRVKGRLTYQIRIDNASPWILNGLSAVGTTSKDGESPRVLSGLSIPPRKNMTVPASEEAVKLLGLKKGIRVMAVDLSGL